MSEMRSFSWGELSSFIDREKLVEVNIPRSGDLKLWSWQIESIGMCAFAKLSDAGVDMKNDFVINCGKHEIIIAKFVLNDKHSPHLFLEFKKSKTPVKEDYYKKLADVGNFFRNILSARESRIAVPKHAAAFDCLVKPFEFGEAINLDELQSLRAELDPIAKNHGYSLQLQSDQFAREYDQRTWSTVYHWFNVHATEL